MLNFPLVWELPNGVGPAHVDQSMLTRSKPGPTSTEKYENWCMWNTSFFWSAKTRIHLWCLRHFFPRAVSLSLGAPSAFFGLWLNNHWAVNSEWQRSNAVLKAEQCIISIEYIPYALLTIYWQLQNCFPYHTLPVLPPNVDALGAVLGAVAELRLTFMPVGSHTARLPAAQM